MSKQYGLILQNKEKKGIVKNIVRPSIFDEDSDSDAPVRSKPTGFSRTRKQDEINQFKALEEDPTVYQYDEVYDEMNEKKVASKLARKDIDKKPKYITKLLAAADRRKRENERRIERQVQKEREAEGETFKDKESFVTSAYKKKLEEMRALEEQEKREEYLEAIGDVTKQGNLDGFYRHLYEQKVIYEDKIKQEIDENQIKKEKESDSDENDIEIPEENEKSDKEETATIKKNKTAKKRKYRSRKESEAQQESDSEGEKEIKKEHLPSNLDADSDFSIDSSSDSEPEEKSIDDKKDEKMDKNIEHQGEKLELPEKGNVLSDNAALAKKNEGKDDKDIPNGKSTECDVKEETEEPKAKKPKIDIWKKRTVGLIFDEAVKRYFERKAEREARQG